MTLSLLCLSWFIFRYIAEDEEVYGTTEGIYAPYAWVVDILQIARHKDLRTTMGYVHTSTRRLHDAVAKLPNASNS